MKKNIAVVSYDAGVRMILSEYLEKLGYKVQTFRYVSEIDTEFEGVVFYFNHRFDVHHMYNCSLAMKKAEFVFLGNLGINNHPTIVNMPFSAKDIAQAISYVA